MFCRWNGQAWVTTRVDDAGDVGAFCSLDFDSSGNPVISYYNSYPGILQVLHCGNPYCTSGNTAFSPDPASGGDGGTSLQLDSSGNPVVTYLREQDDEDLGVLHCGDAYCSVPVGGAAEPPDFAAGASGIGGAYAVLGAVGAVLAITVAGTVVAKRRGVH